MPLPRAPHYQAAETKAMREGLRAAITLTNGDVYTGEWHRDMRHGVCLFVLNFLPSPF